MDRNKFHYMSGAALFAGIMAVLSQFAFPVGAVPVTLQTFVCAFAGGVLGWKWGAVSISVWLLLGALGVPILTMGKAGVGIFLSPVGGYYIGFILMAGFSGIYLKEKSRFFTQGVFALLGLILCYALGTVWFMMYFSLGLGKGMPLWTALTMTVFPFIGFDLIKVAAGVFCGIRIQKALRNAGLFLNCLLYTSPSPRD